CGPTGILLHHRQKYHTIPLGKAGCQCLVSNHLPQDPGILLAGIYLLKRNENIYSQKSTYVNEFSSFIHTCQSVKEPTHPSTNEWTSQLWYIYVMEYYSGTQRNELSIHTTAWLKLKRV
ncbi:LORF2 protein, partial [Crocuta crocuta]